MLPTHSRAHSRHSVHASHNKHAAVTGFTTCRAFRALGLVLGWWYISNSGCSVVVFLCVCLLFSCLVFLPLQRPWAPAKRVITQEQWTHVILHSATVAFTWILWLFGLRECGPFGVLLIEAMDLFVPQSWDASTIALPSLPLSLSPLRKITTFAWNCGLFLCGLSLGGLKGLGLAVFGLAILWFALTESVARAPLEGQVEGEDVLLEDAAAPANQKNVLFAMFCLLASVLLTSFTTQRERVLGPMIGGVKRLHAITVALSASYLMFPAVLLYALSRPVGDVGIFKSLGLYAFSAFSLFVFPFYVDTSTIFAVSSQDRHQFGVVLPLVVYTTLLLWFFGLSSVGLQVVSVSCVLLGAGLFFNEGQPFPTPPPLLSTTTKTAKNTKSSSSSTTHSGMGTMAVVTGFVRSIATTSPAHPNLSVFANPSPRTILPFLHTIANQRPTLLLTLFLLLNLVLTVLEFVYGFATNSLSLLSDAAHMLFDCVALAVGLYAEFMVTWKQDKVFSYGYGRFEVLCGFVNGVFLVLIGFVVLVEGLGRLVNPPAVDTENLLPVSIAGLIVNLIGVVFFHEHHGHSHKSNSATTCTHGHAHASSHHSHNMEGIFLHVLADTLGSVGVLVSWAAMEWYGFTLADPICSVVISFLILASVVPLLRSSMRILVQCVPPHLEHSLNSCVGEVAQLEGVVRVLRPHFWTFANDDVVASLVVVVGKTVDAQSVLRKATGVLVGHGIRQITIQVEREE